ncbi:MAG: hypothetical protein HYZ53_15980 [Planctomycetes bacterium]|nr:hypothetical protein [Planctomycetota bacterium]
METRTKSSPQLGVGGGMGPTPRTAFLSRSLSVARVGVLLVLAGWLWLLYMLNVTRGGVARQSEEIATMELRARRLAALAATAPAPAPSRPRPTAADAPAVASVSSKPTPVELDAWAMRLQTRVDQAARELAELAHATDADEARLRALRMDRIATLSRALERARLEVVAPTARPGTDEYRREVAARLHDRRVVDLRAQIDRDLPGEVERLTKLLELAPEQAARLEKAMRAQADAIAGVSARFLEGEFESFADMERASAEVRSKIDREVEAGLTPLQVLKYRQDERGSWFFRRPKPAPEEK